MQETFIVRVNGIKRIDDHFLDFIKVLAIPATSFAWKENLYLTGNNFYPFL